MIYGFEPTNDIANKEIMRYDVVTESSIINKENALDETYGHSYGYGKADVITDYFGNEITNTKSFFMF